jgi:hypothetical protein
VQYDYNTIDWYELASSVTGYDKFFPMKPSSTNSIRGNGGGYIQDRIEYQGIIVNAGLRIDAYNMDTQMPKNALDPVVIDTLSNSQVVLGMKKEVDSETHVYFSPAWASLIPSPKTPPCTTAGASTPPAPTLAPR